MRYIHNLIPARHGLIIGAAVGIATENIAVGIIIILMFSFLSVVKSIKS